MLSGLLRCLEKWIAIINKPAQGPTHPPSAPATGRDPANMSYSHPAGLLAAYNSLTDKHLAGYFNNTRIRRHLLRSGLITRSGRILSEKEYKLNIMKRDHQKYIRECLAQAIFHKVLDMERYHQLEIKKKLETIARKERVQRYKEIPTRRSIESNIPILSPHPPVGQKRGLGHSVPVDMGHSSPLTVPRPYTAPGNMQPPIRLQPLQSNSSTATAPKITSGPRSKTSLLEHEAPFPIGGKKAVMKFRRSMGKPQGTNLYQLPNITNYLVPIPPPPPPADGKLTRASRVETWRRRRFRPITAPDGLETLFPRDSKRIHKAPLHSNAAITMIYLGKSVHLSYDDSDFRDEIKIYQQHCGGENLCVYKGKLLEKETFQFISKRHHGFPFSLTFFLNGIQVNRLSSCCEYKHRKGSRLGGKRGYFGFVCVERSSPCYKCIIAMGLDKNTSKTRKENAETIKELKKGEKMLRKDNEYLIPRRTKMVENKTTASAIFPTPEEKARIAEVRTAMAEVERKGKPRQDMWGHDQENAFKYEYEEDFEVDEEKQDEKANEDGQAHDQMNGMSKSPSDDEKDNLDPEKDSETSSQKAPDADDNGKDQSDRCSDSELEEDKQDTKTSSSASSSNHPNSACSEISSGEDRDALTEHSSRESTRSSFSQELSENDEPGKSHLPTEDSLIIEIQDQEIIEADVETTPVPREERSEDIPEEEMVESAPVITEGKSAKTKKRVSKKKKEKSKVCDRSSAKAKDEKAGLPSVTKGDRQIIAESLESSCHSHSDPELGVSSSEEQGKHLEKTEIGRHGVLNENLTVEESSVLDLNEESEQVTPEVYTMEQKDATQDQDTPQPRHTDTVEGTEERTLQGNVEVNEIPSVELKTTAVQPELAGEFTVERDIPQDFVSGVGEAGEGGHNLGEEGLSPTGKEVAGDSAKLNEVGTPEEQGLTETVPETDKDMSDGVQGSEKSVLESKAASLNLECVKEGTAVKEAEGHGEAATPLEKGGVEKGAAVSVLESKKAAEEGSQEQAFSGPANVGFVEEAELSREDGPGQATLAGEEPVQGKEGKETMGMDARWSISISERADVNLVGWEESTEEGRKEGTERKMIVIEAEVTREDGGKEVTSQELDAVREREKAENSDTYLREAEPEREQGERTHTLEHEDAAEEGNLFDEKETVKENRTEEEKEAPTEEVDRYVASEALLEESELTESPRLQRENSPAVRGTSMFEEVPGFEVSLENMTASRKEEEGGGRPTEGKDTGHNGEAELLHEDNIARPEVNEGPRCDGAAVSGVPASELAGKVQTSGVTVTTTDEAEECEAEGPDCVAGPEERQKEGSSQGQDGVGNQGEVPEGGPMMAETFSEEAVDEAVEEEEAEQGGRTGAKENRGAGVRGSLEAGAVVSEEGPKEGETAEVATEKMEETTANKASSSAVAGEDTWHEAHEYGGKAAAAQRAAVEATVPSRGAAPVVQEVAAAPAPEAQLGTLQGPSHLPGVAPHAGGEQEGRDEETELRASVVEVVVGTGSRGEGPESGAAEALRPSEERTSEPGKESPQAVGMLPVKSHSTETFEKQEPAVPRDREDADVSGSHVKTSETARQTVS
ncbi:LOW QUALITY PROTEIN: glutamate-rich protein 3 [Rhynchocyon petersi]